MLFSLLCDAGIPVVRKKQTNGTKELWLVTSATTPMISSNCTVVNVSRYWRSTVMRRRGDMEPILRWRMWYGCKPRTKVSSGTVLYPSTIQHPPNTNLQKSRMLQCLSLSSMPSCTVTSRSLQHRIFSTSSTGSGSTASTTTTTKNVSDVFLDNLGKIFLGAIASIVALLVRSSYGTSNQTRERELLEETSLLDPLEIDDLRAANIALFHNNSSLFTDIIIQTSKSFPTGWASYLDFISVVMDVFGKTCSTFRGEEPMTKVSFLKFGHLIDRIVIDILENTDKYEGMIQFTHEEGESDSANVKLPLTFLLTILSLALPWSVEDRINSLFDILVAASSTTDFQEEEEEIRNDDRTDDSSPTIHIATNNTDVTRTIPEQSVIDMIGFLQASCQLPPGPQILATDKKYPVQHYKRGTPNELMSLAKKDALGFVEGKRRYNSNEFNTVLRCNYICAWGECYGPRKRTMIGKE